MCLHVGGDAFDGSAGKTGTFDHDLARQCEQHRSGRPVDGLSLRLDGQVTSWVALEFGYAYRSTNVLLIAPSAFET